MKKSIMGLPTEKLLAEIHERGGSTRLREDVCELLGGGDRNNVNDTWLKMFAEPMVLHGNAL